MAVFYCTLLDKEFYLYYFFLFFLNKSFQSLLSTLSIWSFKIFSSYTLSINFSFNIEQFNLQRLTIRYAFFKWLWMVLFRMEIGLLVSGFTVENCLKDVVLVFICQCVQKWILLCETLCSNLIVLYLLLKFSKSTSSSCLIHVYIMHENITEIS